MPVSVFDHPILSGLLGDEEASACFSLEAELAAMLLFESALAQAEAAEGLIEAEAGEAITEALKAFRPDIDALRAGAARDGLVVPELVSQLRRHVGETHGKSVHFGATSQDVVDTGLALRLVRLLALLKVRLEAVVMALQALDEASGAIETMAHTRMQAAIAVPARRKIRSWREPLVRHLDRIPAIEEGIAIVHFGGAAGTLEKLGDKSIGVSRRLAERLGLRSVLRARHSERDGIVAFANWLALVTGSLGKFGQDVALLAQSEVGEIKLAAGGGSSAMPHKVNPIAAETLVALARFNATAISGLHHSMVHENERSGAAWTLEWMLLPQMAVATAAALSKAEALLAGLSFAEPATKS